jgi:hypothetical protein
MSCFGQLILFPLSAFPVLRRLDMMPSVSAVTRILDRVQQGDPHAAAELLPLVYEELRRLAARSLRRRRRPRDRLLGLLAAHDRAGKFLEHKAPEPGASAAADAAPVCQRCGKPLSAHGLKGLCPSCRLLGGLVEQLVVPSSGGPAEAGTTSESGTAADEAVRAPLTEKAGDRSRRYKLLELVGEGGFGTVWMAEQEEPVRRRVALKIIH